MLSPVATDRWKGAEMARLSEILIPGERVVVRYFPAWVLWGAALFVALGLFMPVEFYLKGLFDDRDGSILLYIFSGNVAIVLLGFLYLLPWRVVVTDRRLLIRKGAFGSDYTEIRRDLVEEVRFAGTTLTIRAKDHTLETSILLPFARRIVRTLDPALDSTGHAAVKLVELLHPGEAILYRDPSATSLKWTLGSMAALSAAAPVLVWYLTDFENGMDWFTLAMFYVGLLPTAFTWRRHYGWRAAVTDSRLLVRREHDVSRFDAIALGEIETVERDDKAKRLHISGAGRHLEIPCNNRKSAKLLAAIGREAVARGKGTA